MSQSEAPPFAPVTVPDRPFVAPLILRAASRRRVVILRDLGITLLIWCGWLYLLIAAIGIFWLPPFVHEMLPVHAPKSPWVTLLIVFACAGVATGTTALISGRALRDRRRFRGADRRRGASEPEDGILGTTLRADGVDLPALRAARRIVLHHGPDGAVLRADTLPGSPAR